VSSPMERLSREQILAALDALNRRVAELGKHAQLYLVGGVVMCLVYEVRSSTLDVDGWFTEPSVVRAAAKLVARELGLPDDWLNDAAKAFIPKGEAPPSGLLEAFPREMGLFTAALKRSLPEVRASAALQLRSLADAFDFKTVLKRDAQGHPRAWSIHTDSEEYDLYTSVPLPQEREAQEARGPPRRGLHRGARDRHHEHRLDDLQRPAQGAGARAR